jgi:hypothetical protein
MNSGALLSKVKLWSMGMENALYRVKFQVANFE